MSAAYERLLALADELVKHRGADRSDLLCPGHDDGRRPSLTLTARREDVLMCCNVGCETPHVLACWPGGELPMAALYDSWWERRNGREPVAVYRYEDEHGGPLFEVVRFPGKEFRQRRPDGEWGIQGVRRVLYRLPRVTAAIEAGETIYVVEGEKDVHAIEGRGGVATCNPGGAGKWRREYAELLSGADVIVVADRDEPGRKHAADVMASLPDALLVEPKEGKDAADHLAAGHGLDRFVAVPAQKKARRFPDRRTDLVALLSQPPRPIPWRVAHLAADGKLTTLTGTGDVGKSWLMIACCLRVSDGGQVAGMACGRGRAFYVDAEMGGAEFAERLRGLGATGHELDHFDAAGFDFSRSDAVEWLEGEIEENGYRFVVLDSLRALAPSMKENESDSAAPVLIALRNVARRTGAAIVVVHHKGESDKFYRGSTAIRDQSDAMLTLWEDEQGLRLRCKPGGRMKFAPSPPDLWLKLDLFGEGMALAGDPGPPAPSQREILKQQIVRHLPSETKSAVAAAIGTNRAASAFMGAWKELEMQGEIDRIAGVWTAVALADPLGAATTQQHVDHSNGGPPQSAIFDYEEDR